MNGVSLVICTYNGVERLEPTLHSIFAQKVSSAVSWEVIIIDNASTDNTNNFCLNLKEKEGFGGDFRVVLEEHQGAAYARARALKEAKYSWLLFCDDDNHL